MVLSATAFDFAWTRRARCLSLVPTVSDFIRRLCRVNCRHAVQSLRYAANRLMSFQAHEPNTHPQPQHVAFPPKSIRRMNRMKHSRAYMLTFAAPVPTGDMIAVIFVVVLHLHPSNMTWLLSTCSSCYYYHYYYYFFCALPESGIRIQRSRKKCVTYQATFGFNLVSVRLPSHTRARKTVAKRNTHTR